MHRLPAARLVRSDGYCEGCQMQLSYECAVTDLVCVPYSRSLAVQTPRNRAVADFVALYAGAARPERAAERFVRSVFATFDSFNKR